MLTWLRGARERTALIYARCGRRCRKKMRMAALQLCTVLQSPLLSFREVFAIAVAHRPETCELDLLGPDPAQEIRVLEQLVLRDPEGGIVGMQVLDVARRVAVQRDEGNARGGMLDDLPIGLGAGQIGRAQTH